MNWKRRPQTLVAAVLVGGLSAAGCVPAPDEQAAVAVSAPDEALERARAAAGELGRRLAGELTERLGADGPAAAIDVCSEIAPAAARELSRDGIEVRRTSERYRNPRNAPDDWELAGLELLERRLAAGASPEEIHEFDEVRGELRYLRPILAGGQCLQCHGAADALDPEVLERIAERYPDDRATGFAAGDLRGAFSVRVRVNPSDSG